MPLFGSVGHTQLAGNDWHGGRSPLERSNNEPPSSGDEWSEDMRKLQLSVATSTFSVMLVVGFFCTCLYFVCCRPKKQRKIRGKAWSNEATYGIPSTTTNGHILDPNALSLNPYMISPYVQGQLFGKDSSHDHFVGGGGPEGEMNGFYHFYPMEKPGMGEEGSKGQAQIIGTDGENVGGEAHLEKGVGGKEEPSYKPFLPRMKEWEPPTEPSQRSSYPYHESVGGEEGQGKGHGYQELVTKGHENPAYTYTENETGSDHKWEKKGKEPEVGGVLWRLKELGEEYGVGGKSDKSPEKVNDHVTKVNYAEIHATPYNPEYKKNQEDSDAEHELNKANMQ